MKILILAMMAVFALGYSFEASAQCGTNCYHGGVTGDSGSALKFFGTNRLCNCTDCGWVSGGGDSCGYGLSYKGNNENNTQSCCKDLYGGCPLCVTEEDWKQFNEQLELRIKEDEAAEKMGANDLDNVFDPLQSVSYWGYAGTTIRSPNTGRTTSAKARLDACLFHTDVDAIDAGSSTVQGRWDLCVGSTLGCANTIKNDYCESNGAAVCIDRCDCVYSGSWATCNNL